MAVAAAVASAPAASSSTVVAATVPSATTISVDPVDGVGGACRPGATAATHLGTVLPGASVVAAADCAVAFGSSNDTATLRVSQPDGGGVAMWGITSGRLDASFDGPTGAGNGAIIDPISGAGTDWLVSGAIQSDGAFVGAGYCHNGVNDDFCLVRYLHDGSLDPTFDGPDGTGDGSFLDPIASGNDLANGMAIDATGRIVAAGSCGNGTNDDFCVARYLADGTPDPSFDGPSGSANGAFLSPVGAGNDWGYTADVGADGAIVVGGACHNGTNFDFCLVRFLEDGTRDPSFDGPSGSGNGAVTLAIGSGNDYLKRLEVGADGSIVAAGECDGAGGHDFCVARLLGDGSLDPAFDGPSGTANGAFLDPIGSAADNMATMTSDRSGRILLAGGCNNGVDLDMCLVRYLPDGMPDPSFDGPSGIADGAFLDPMGGTGNEYGRGLVVQPDGAILVTGWCPGSVDIDYCAARYHDDGTPDAGLTGPSGASAGSFTLSMAAGADISTSAVEGRDGRVFVIGSCMGGGGTRDFCLARLDHEGSVPDYANGATDWDTVGTGAFGACLRSLAGDPSTSTWLVDADATCGPADTDPWNAIPATQTTIARTSAVGGVAVANLRFGMRAATSQQSGSYVAPITFQVVAPAT